MSTAVCRTLSGKSEVVGCVSFVVTRAGTGVLEDARVARAIEPPGSWLAVGAGEVAVDRGAAHAEGLGDHRHRVLAGRVHLPGNLELVGGHHRRSAAVAGLGPGQ